MLDLLTMFKDVFLITPLAHSLTVDLLRVDIIVTDGHWPVLAGGGETQGIVMTDGHHYLRSELIPSF